jgi:LTXXQ motif family protein
MAMKRTLLGALAALALSTSGFALTAATAQSDQQPSHAERMQHWAADRETLLDAKLAGMKAGLGLNADQEKLWAPFESAVKDAAKARMEAMQQMMQTRMQGERLSPVDRLDAVADRLAQGAADIKKIADAAKPLYASLDASQKEKFALLGRDMLIPQRARFAMEMWRHRESEMGQGGGQ